MYQSEILNLKKELTKIIDGTHRIERSVKQIVSRFHKLVSNPVHNKEIEGNLSQDEYKELMRIIQIQLK